MISNVFAIVGVVFLAVGMTAVVFLVTDLIFKGGDDGARDRGHGGLFATVWFVLPLLRKAADYRLGVSPPRIAASRCRVDVAAGDDADELAAPRPARERGGDGERAGALGDHAGALGEQADAAAVSSSETVTRRRAAAARAPTSPAARPSRRRRRRTTGAYSASRGSPAASAAATAAAVSGSAA